MTQSHTSSRHATKPACQDDSHIHTLRNPRWLTRVNSHSAVLLLVLLATLVRVVWLAQFSTLTLIEDEAHYWLWSTHPDWSYYSKGPAVAWLIWLSTNLFGTSECAVRLPAALSAAIGALAAADIARSLSPAQALKHTHAFVAAAVYLLAPALAVTGFLMTIDAPFLACWMLAVAFTLRAQSNPKLWAAVGAALALGFLFKYTIALLVPGVLWVMLRNQNRTPRLWCVAILLAVSSLGTIPVLLWNANHDWATLRHLIGHLGLLGGDTAPTNHAALPLTQRALWSLEYLALLFFIVGPIPMILIVARLFHRFDLPERTTDTLRMAAPIALFYLVVSLINRTEGNWAIAAPATLIPAAAYAIVRGVQHNLWPIRFLWGATLVTGLGTWVGIFGLHTISKVPALDFIPAHRALGMRDHAAAVQAELDRLEQETGMLPFVITTHYGRASLLSFYLENHPAVYCTSAHTGGRRSQFDIWPHTSLANPDTQRALVARPALALGGNAQHWLPAFEAIQPLGRLHAEPKHRQNAYLAFAYRGFNTWTPWQSRQGWTGPNAPPNDPAHAILLPPRSPAITPSHTTEPNP